MTVLDSLEEFELQKEGVRKVTTGSRVLIHLAEPTPFPLHQ